MEKTEAVSSYVLLYEILPIEEALTEVVTVRASASNFDRDWLVVVNGDIKEAKVTEETPTSSGETTIQANQALIFLGDTHAGVIGAGAGEFYDDRFDAPDGSLKEEFMTDIQREYT